MNAIIISFWESVVEEFYLINFGKTKDKMLEQLIAEEITNNETSWRKVSKSSCIRRAKKKIELLPRDDKMWEAVFDVLRKKNVDKHITIFKKNDIPYIAITIGTFSALSPLCSAEQMVKKWKSIEGKV